MQTVYIVEPAESSTKQALSQLIDSLQKLYPGEIKSGQCLSVTSENPDLVKLFSNLANKINDQALHVPEGRRPYRRKILSNAPIPVTIPGVKSITLEAGGGHE